MSSSRREPSLRAQARARYLQATEAEAHEAEAHKDSGQLAPSPTLPRKRGREPTELAAGEPTELAAGEPTELAAGEPTELAAGEPTELAAGEHTELAAGEQTDHAAAEHTERAAPAEFAAGESSPPDAPSAPSLNERARALYEGGVVPVCAIARLCGVSERTIYKHARRLAWTPRVTRRAGDGRPSAAQRAARGAGGRFVPLAEADAPHAHGLKALDPDARQEASTACAQASVRADRAREQALAAAQARAVREASQRATRARERRFDLLSGALVDLVPLLGERGGRLSPQAERLCARLAHVILDQMAHL